MSEAPPWVCVVLVPLVNVLLALAMSASVIVLIGEDPVDAVGLLVLGALGSQEAIGYTLYYATNLVFTGLAVAVAFHAGLFNIGAEGQAYIGGLGVGLVCLGTDRVLPFALILPLAMIVSCAFGAAWAFVPAWLQARRGSHIVITTIMFNFLASALMVYLMVNVLSPPGSMAPETREFEAAARLPFVHETLAAAGIRITPSPLNVSIVWAVVCCVGVWLFIWHTRWGYAMRALGHNERAAVYGGMRPTRIIVLAMCFSGALTAGVGLNEVMGVNHRLLLEFTFGYGFTGIAVALMGRNHPLGIVLAALLFGILYQGGAELAFEIPAITRDIVVVIQGLVILFCGALEFMLRPRIERLFAASAPAGGG